MELKELEPVCNQGKNRPIYIQGTKEYVNTVEQSLSELGVGSDESIW